MAFTVVVMKNENLRGTSDTRRSRHMFCGIFSVKRPALVNRPVATTGVLSCFFCIMTPLQRCSASKRCSINAIKVINFDLVSQGRLSTGNGILWCSEPGYHRIHKKFNLLKQHVFARFGARNSLWNRLS